MLKFFIFLAVTSPGVIEIWEGLVTFAFFPITVFTAWIADIKLIQVHHKWSIYLIRIS